MDNNSIALKKFVIEFFKDFKIKEKKDVLYIESAPEEFEKLIGKKTPYNIVFDVKKHGEIPGSNLIVSGSYFLSVMRDYLKNKGQTSLLKISFDVPEININKKISCGNCKIVENKPSESYKFLSEFTFLSSLQYLNEKKEMINKILVKDGKCIEINLPKVEEGDRKYVEKIDSNLNYCAAQNQLKKLINKESKTLKVKLKTKLVKELDRIKDYYHKQIAEKDEDLDRCKDKIKTLESELKNTFYDRDARILKMKIRQYLERLESLKARDYKKRLETEKIFHTTDEIDKHSLQISHSIVNASIIYYACPSFNIKLINKKNNAEKTIELVYDSMAKNIESIKCDICKKNAIKINLSENNDLVCENCLNKHKSNKK